MSLFDRSFPIEITTAVPIRELSRSPARLVDRVERDGEVIALHRYGRIVAVLAPLPEKMVLRLENDPPPTRNEDDHVDVEIPDWLEESAAAQAVLGYALRNNPMPYGIDGIVTASGLPLHDILVNKSMLELEGFADQTMRGNYLTPLGLATARMLQRRLDTENDRPAS